MTSDTEYRWRWIPFFGIRTITEPEEIEDYGQDPEEVKQIKGLVFEWFDFSFMLLGVCLSGD